ncbi:MAG TPA: GlxA family transcriptional regulator [Rhizomicrobium sp.]
MKTVALAIFPGVQALDVAGPMDVFAEANGFLGDGEKYEVTLVASTREPFKASNGMWMAADTTFEAARQGFGLALVAGGPGLPTGAPENALVQWLAGQAGKSRRYGSICTGAFALGAAGLIDDRTVTTHWENAALLAQRYPRARVECDRIYLKDRDLVTSAGVTAGIDLCLSLVAEDHGTELSLKVAKRLVVVAQRQGGQSQFSPYLVQQSDPGSPIARVFAHVMEHIDAPNDVKALAAVAGMSPRSFARVFKQETAMTPADFVEGARIDTARNKLEATSLPLKTVAFQSGFSSAEHMRIAFTRRLGVTPSQYRASFRPHIQ